LEERLRDKMAKNGMYSTSLYKATSSVDGLPYALRKIEGFRYWI